MNVQRLRPLSWGSRLRVAAGVAAGIAVGIAVGAAVGMTTGCTAPSTTQTRAHSLDELYDQADRVNETADPYAMGVGDQIGATSYVKVLEKNRKKRSRVASQTNGKLSAEQQR